MRGEKRPTGLTRDTGWEIGVRRTLPLTPAAAWELVTAPAGLRCWLGDLPGAIVAVGTAYQLTDGTHGSFTVLQPGSHLRMTWQPPEWPRPSIIQVRVIAHGDRGVIAFHQEHMPSEQARVARRAWFSAALDKIERLGAEDTPDA